MRMITRDEYLKALDIVEKYHEQIKQKVDSLDKIGYGDLSDNHLLSIRIKDLPLMAKTINRLTACGFDTLGDIVRQDKSQLQCIRNLGRKSINDLEDILDEKGLRFGMKV